MSYTPDTPLHQLRFLANRVLGRPTVLDVRILGQTLRLDIQARREIRRAHAISHEEALVQRMFDHLAPADVVYDVGANIGILSLLLALHPQGRSTRIHSFEPEPRNFAQLRRNIELNGLSERVTSHQLALGSAEGEVELFVRGGPGEGRHSIATRKGSTGSIRVPLTTASAFAHRIPPRSGQPSIRPDVVKIDVEGAEGQVLAGMEGLIAEHGPREIFMEIHPKGDRDRMPNGESIHDWLVARGYGLAWQQSRRSGEHRHYN